MMDVSARKPDGIVSLSETDKAYFAGLFDADGHISILSSTSNRTKRQYWLQIGITQSNKVFLKAIQEKLGAGKIYRNNKAGTNGFHSKERYQLQIFGKSATQVLVMLSDFLILKKQQAAIGIEFGETITGRVNDTMQEKRESLRQRMLEANHSNTNDEPKNY